MDSIDEVGGSIHSLASAFLETSREAVFVGLYSLVPSIPVCPAGGVLAQTELWEQEFPEMSAAVLSSTCGQAALRIVSLVG